MQRLKNKNCLITGAARGIGRAIAEAFFREGAQVWMTDIDMDALKISSKKIGCDSFKLDVRLENNWLNAIEKTGPLNVVVNNAGITGFENGGAPHDPEHASLTDWRAVHETNLDGVFLGCKYAIRSMRQSDVRQADGGSIINISSRSGMVGVAASTAYASSKAAVRNHTKSVALYCAQEKLDIRCNSIHPAAIMTPMWDAMLGEGPDRELAMASFVKDTPMKRFGDPDEVATLAVMLASDEAQYMTGAELTIDGGLLAGSAAAPQG
jgi:3(or 17)beta-hydroxysteroid dehydrogenase